MTGAQGVPATNPEEIAMTSFSPSGGSRHSLLSRGRRNMRANSGVRLAARRGVAKASPAKRIRAGGLFVAALMTGIACAAPTDLDWRWDADGMLFPPVPADGFIKQMLLGTDGSLVVGSDGDDAPCIARFDSTGRRDDTFGTQGCIDRPPDPFPSRRYRLAGMELRANGRLDAQWYYGFAATPSVYECSRLWARYLSSGEVDAAFGQNGFLRPQDSGSRSCSLGDQSDGAGNRFRLDQMFVYWVPINYSWIRGLSPDGSSLPPMTPFDTARWGYISLRIDRHDRLVIGLSTEHSSGFAVGRTGAGSFGNDGIALVQLPGTPSAPGVHPLPDGGVLAFGSIGAVDATGARQAVVVRFTEDGKPDAGFGESGAVVIPFARAGDTGVRRVKVAPLRDGRLLVVAEVDGSVDAWRKFVHLRMARLMSNGSPDTSFAADGIATVWTNGETLLHDGPIVRPSGEFLVASSNVVYQFRGGDLAVPYPPAQRAAVEYFHAAYGHYFVTADVLELATLDASAASGWARTGKSFTVYGSSEPGLAPVCRFWSGQSFAPKSSHFYTPYADECAKVKQDPAWLFERNAFYVRMPAGAEGARTCPAGTQPLYRAYNDGMGGAPNHRYTTDPAVLDAMIAQGWTMEGEAATRVFACVPLQD